MEKEERGVCKDCHDKMVLVEEPKCKCCGKGIEHKEDEFCYDCKKSPMREVKQGFALWEYNQHTKNVIHRFKYDGRIEYAHYFVEEILFHYGERWKSIGFDMLIPVPLHKKRERFRGFNQAEVLAKGLSERLQVPLVSDWLVRRKNTKPQNGLDDKERNQNLCHAFEVLKKEKTMPNRVLLVDDIYTTGTTIRQCAAVLKEAGVKEIYFICLCIGRDF